MLLRSIDGYKSTMLTVIAFDDIFRAVKLKFCMIFVNAQPAEKN